MKIQYKWILPGMIVIASCQVTRKYQQPAPPPSAQYRVQLTTDSNTIATIPWHSFFTDTVLQSLIQEGIDNNTDLKIAYQRILISKAYLWKSKQAFLPELTGNAGIKQSKLAFPQAFGFVKEATQYDVGIAASWEADIWGKLSSAQKAAYARLMATTAAQRAVQTQLIADIATNYVLLLSLDEQLKLLNSTIANRQEDVKTMEALNASNIVNGAAVVQSKANHADAKVAIPDVKKQIRETENAICLLLNRAPGPIKRGALSSFSLPADFRVGVPATLLGNRPDVKEAEQLLRTSFENTNVARSFFYPSLTITGGSGFSSFDFSNWFSGTSLFANIAGGLAQPILAKGENKARLKTAEADQQIAMYNFQKIMMQASQEVSNALFVIETAEEKHAERSTQLQFLEQSVTFIKELLKYNSSTNYIDVLTSENNLLIAQTHSIEDTMQKIQGIIQLYRALGGGWR
ncbi:TolC family protein [Chitinophaga sp. G-6-1-13]|uniref:TolC family protein n=1 Tax=Chitinophaga fulva TaxID=2728842 RepID=A0A848GEY6_9BACT|nr:TolC family protein [Chitinophaga fulva]NML36626.1 TolC family protein [Chitinophaga fulva]